MGADAETSNAADPDSRWLYRVGGISALVLGAAYIAIIPLFAQVGGPPSSGEAWLKYLSGKIPVWWAILGLSVLTDLLFVPVALALYLALKRVHRGAMLVATVFVGLFVVLDLAVTWTSFAALLTLGRDYAAAADDVQRAAYVAAANYPSAVLASPLEVVYAIVILSFAILVIGIVMWKGSFSRATALLGVITGILGIASLTRVTAIIIANALFATAWVLFVGYRLYRLSRQ
jgi:hypothetical protein